MKIIRRGRVLMAIGVGLTALISVGCQAQMAGMTLPSGRYLEHRPQYFPEDPDFPLQRELAYQEEMAGLSAPGNRGGAPNGGVNPVPPGFGMPIPAPAPR